MNMPLLQIASAGEYHLGLYFLRLVNSVNSVNIINTRHEFVKWNLLTLVTLLIVNKLRS